MSDQSDVICVDSTASMPPLPRHKPLAAAPKQKQPFPPYFPSPSPEPPLPFYLVPWTELEGMDWTSMPSDTGGYDEDEGLVEDLVDVACQNCRISLRGDECIQYAALKPLQKRAVKASAEGRDVFMRLTTGYGKTLAFEVAAMVAFAQTGKMTIVVSPLIALINDQFSSAVERCLPAAHITGDSYQAPQSTTAIVFLTPEQLVSFVKGNYWGHCIDRDKIARFVLDEIHCRPLWEFRESYKIVDELRSIFPSVPITACTATCSLSLEDHLTKTLHLKHVVRVFDSANRPNFIYQVLPKKTASVKRTTNPFKNENDRGATQLHEVLVAAGLLEECGIVYCRTKDEAERVSAFLKSKGIKSEYFHAGRAALVKKQIAQDWRNGKVHVVCATVAFGLGVDKPDVRFVFHLSMPRSLSGYIQESGRGGRDDKPCLSIIFFRLNDADKCYEEGPKTKDESRDNVNKVVAFCINSTECRRVQLLEELEEEFDAGDCEGMCDNCQARGEELVEDVTVIAKYALELLRSNKVRGSPYKPALTRGKWMESLSKFTKTLAPKKHKSSIHEIVVQHLISRDIVRLSPWEQPSGNQAYLNLYPERGANAGYLDAEDAKFKFRWRQLGSAPLIIGPSSSRIDNCSSPSPPPPPPRNVAPLPKKKVPTTSVKPLPAAKKSRSDSSRRIAPLPAKKPQAPHDSDRIVNRAPSSCSSSDGSDDTPIVVEKVTEDGGQGKSLQRRIVWIDISSSSSSEVSSSSQDEEDELASSAIIVDSDGEMEGLTINTNGSSDDEDDDDQCSSPSPIGEPSFSSKIQPRYDDDSSRLGDDDGEKDVDVDVDDTETNEEESVKSSCDDEGACGCKRCVKIDGRVSADDEMVDVEALEEGTEEEAIPSSQLSGAGSLRRSKRDEAKLADRRIKKSYKEFGQPKGGSKIR